MKTFTVDYQAHIEQIVTTTTLAIRVERADGTILRVTKFNRALTYAAEVYEPFGFLASDVTTENDMSVGTQELTGILRSDSITEDDLRAGRWDHAEYTIFRFNWADPTMGRDIVSTGNVGVVRSGRLRFVAELLDLMQVASYSIGVLNSPACLHELGDNNAAPGRGNGCTVDLAPWTTTGTIDSVDSDLYGVHDAARAEAVGYFSNGVMTITSGTMNGMRFPVRSYIVGFWVLFTALPDDATGATYSIHRGCDKTRRTCIDVFAAINDRLASDFTQGNDRRTQVARHNG